MKTKPQHIYRYLLWIEGLLLLTSLVACVATTEEPPSVTSISPRLLPDFLIEVYPDQGATLSLDSYETKICLRVDACELLRKGDFWDFDDVYERTNVLVNGQPTDGLFGPMWYSGMMGCTIEDPLGNRLAQVGGPYEWCLCISPTKAGVYRADMSFEKSSGEVVSFAWTFELVDGPIPTPTPLPTPSVIDRAGLLPDYLEEVYPAPGEMVSPPQNWEEWPALLEERGMPPAILTEPSMQPICVTLVYSEMLKLGPLPKPKHRTGDSRLAIDDRLYLAVDQRTPSGWLYPGFGSFSLINTRTQCSEAILSPGEHVATLYIDPYGPELIRYSWAFTIEER